MAQQCKAHNKQGQRCKQPVVPGREVCRYHGGLTPRGIAHPNFKHGRYSKSLPTRLAAQYQSAINDPELLKLDDEIALIETRIHELLGQLDQHSNQALWDDLSKACRAIQAAARTENRDLLARSIEDMDRILDKRHQYELWDELYRVVDVKRRLVESRRLHLIQEQQIISAEQAMTLVSALLESIHRAVPERSTRAQIEHEFASIIGAYHLPQP